MADYPALVLTTALHERLDATAPGVVLAVLPWRGPAEAVALVAFAPPIAVAGFRLELAWHGRRDNDAVIRHAVREMIPLMRPPNFARSL